MQMNLTERLEGIIISQRVDDRLHSGFSIVLNLFVFQDFSNHISGSHKGNFMNTILILFLGDFIINVFKELLRGSLIHL